MEEPTSAETAELLLSSMPDADLETLLKRVVSSRVSSQSPDEALRFLFRLDESLYILESMTSVRYDGGVHTKHRHTRYHDFFVNQVHKGERVLDVGCGIGYVSYDVAERAEAWVVAVDINEGNIQIAKERFSHPRITYKVADALTLPYGEKFDLIVLSNVLEHLDNRPQFLKKLCEAFSPSRILVRVPLFERDWRVPLKEELGMDYRLDSTHFTEYTLESFSDEVSAAGLQITHQEVRWGEIWAVVCEKI